MDNHNKKENHSMMWMMVLCVLPLVILLFAGGKAFSAGYLWPILIGGFIVAHFWMMLRGHGSQGKDHNEHNAVETEKDKSATSEKKDHSCRH